MTTRLTARDRQLRSIAEAELQRTVQAMLTATGWLWYHAPDNRPGRAGHVQNVKAGFPDLIAVRGARTIFLELKRETGTTTPEQKTWIAALLAAGHEVHVIRPSDIENLAHILAPNWA